MRPDSADRPQPRPRRLSYANVVATLALVLALTGGGAAYAAVRINGGSILPRTVPGSALKDGAVTSAKVADRSLLAKDFKPGQLPRGATGPTGPKGAPGVGLGTYGESVSVDTAVASNLVPFAATDAAEVPLWSGAWFGPVAVPGHGAWLATAAVEVATTSPSNDMTCTLESKVGSGGYDEITRATAAPGEAVLRFTHPFIRFAGAVATLPEQFRVRCSSTGSPSFDRTVSAARLTVQGAFRVY